MMAIAPTLVQTDPPRSSLYTESMIHVFRPIPVERLKLLVFDLDGTLIDSAQDLCNSVNAALNEFGLAPLPDPAIAGFVGNGAPMLMRRSLACAGNVTPTRSTRSLRQRLRLFPAVLSRTQARLHLRLRRRARRAQGSARAARRTRRPARIMAVLTNKPVRPARGICEGLGLADYFLHIYGGDSFPLKKPDPLGLRTLMDEVGAALKRPS